MSDSRMMRLGEGMTGWENKTLWYKEDYGLGIIHDYYDR